MLTDSMPMEQRFGGTERRLRKFFRRFIFAERRFDSIKGRKNFPEATTTFLFCVVYPSFLKSNISIIGMRINNFHTPAVISVQGRRITYINSDKVTVIKEKRVIVNPYLAALLGLRPKAITE